MDLVVGSTGRVGRAVTRRLAEEGRSVRALVRGAEGRPEVEELAAAGIRVVEGDLTRPDTLAPALEGIDLVVCTATSMPEARDDGLRKVDHTGVLDLIDAAEEAGVGTFIYTSYSGNISRESPLQLAKRSCERRLAEADFLSVVLRPSYFMEAWLSPLLGFDPGAGTARIYGPGDRPVSYISWVDVVEFAVAAARTKFDEDAVLELGGPEALSQLEAVDVFERELDREIRLERVPLESLEEQHRSPDPLQKTFAALMLALADGDEIPDARATAERFGVSLRSVTEHARGIREGEEEPVA